MLEDKNMAVEQFSQAIKIDSAFTAAYFYRGVSYFKLGNYTKAIDDFNHVSTIDTSIPIVYAYKGFAYRQLGNKELSLQSFRKYMENADNPDAIDFKLLGRAQMSVGDLDGAIESFELAEYDEANEGRYYYLYQAYSNQGEYRKALTQINLAIEVNNAFYGYYLNRGNTKLMLGEFTNALEDYNYALELEPSVPDSYYLRGRVLDTLAIYDKAINDFSYAIELNPKDGTYYSKRGNARFSFGDREGACLDWTIANNLGYYEDFNKIKTLCE